MAQPDRETVYAALLTLLNNSIGPGGNSTFATVSRRLVAVNSFPTANAPALFQVQNNEDVVAPKGLPGVRTFSVHLVIYQYFGGSVSTVPTTALNNLVTAVEGALGPNLATGFQQLGIPISNVTVRGRIEYWEQAGTAGDWGVSLVPVELTANY